MRIFKTNDSWEDLLKSKQEQIVESTERTQASTKGNKFYVPRSDTNKITKGFGARSHVKVPDFLKSQLDS